MSQRRPHSQSTERKIADMSQQLQRRGNEGLVPVGSLYDPAAVSQGLAIAMEQCHLISPATSCGQIPEGFAVAFSSVLIDKNKDHGEVYAISGSSKLGLAKPAIERLAGGIGMTPVPGQSYRLDNGKMRHYCVWQTVMAYQDLNGEMKFLVGTKVLDYRDGSAQSALVTSGMLPGKRSNIESLAETCSRLRAIRSIGIKTAYLPEELDKPFVMVRLIRTGHSEDPELAREFKRAQFMAGLDSSKRLFGAPTSVQTFAPAGLIEAPAAVATQVEEDDYIADTLTPQATAGGGDDGGPRDSSPTNTSSVQAKRTVPFGPNKGKKITDIPIKDINYLWDYYEKAIADPAKGRWKAQNEAELKAIVDEAARRDNDSDRY